MSIIRENLMKEKGYSPYCGNDNCKPMPRTFFNGEQFECKWCGWISRFPVEFIEEYKKKWKIGHNLYTSLKPVEKVPDLMILSPSDAMSEWD